MDYRTKALELLKPILHHGMEISPTGSLRIWHRPDIAPEAWHCLIYAGLTPNFIDDYISKYNFPIPETYVNFLKCSDGLRIAQLFTLYGLNTSNPDPWSRPISIRYGNIWERPWGLPKHFFGIGGLVGYETLWGYYLDTHTDQIVICKNLGIYRLIHTWPSFDNFFVKEITRILALFDEKGKLIIHQESVIDSLYPDGKPPPPTILSKSWWKRFTLKQK